MLYSCCGPVLGPGFFHNKSLCSTCTSTNLDQTKNVLHSDTFSVFYLTAQSPRWWLITVSISTQKHFLPFKKTQRLFSFSSPPFWCFFPASEGYLAVLSESDGSQRETKIWLEAWIYHDWGFWTDWPAATTPAPAGPELLAAAQQRLWQVLQSLHGQLQQQHHLWRIL